ncbi:hypothetical protein [Geobacillus sp. CAMR5420]|uniref:hypothetical protein n=1 Tax=Geobacillus sp. CAMR5420 TaxID=1482739 RepID=UPI00240EEB89|nr:hypothetical protein [Geobacillus sp. CAMR5420]
MYGGAQTYACSCVPPRSPSEEFTKSDAVFSGKVVRIYETTRKEPEIRERVPKRAVVFSVNRTWKGVNETHVVVYTGFHEADCGYPFEVGKEYLVYAYDDTDWVTGICSLTKPLSLAKPDIEAFGKGKPPTQHVAAEELKEGRWNPFFPYMIVICVIGFVAFLYVVQKRLQK